MALVTTVTRIPPAIRIAAVEKAWMQYLARFLHSPMHFVTDTVTLFILEQG